MDPQTQILVQLVHLLWNLWWAMFDFSFWFNVAVCSQIIVRSTAESSLFAVKAARLLWKSAINRMWWPCCCRISSLTLMAFLCLWQLVGDLFILRTFVFSLLWRSYKSLSCHLSSGHCLCWNWSAKVSFPALKEDIKSSKPNVVSLMYN